MRRGREERVSPVEERPAESVQLCFAHPRGCSGRERPGSERSEPHLWGAPQHHYGL